MINWTLLFAVGLTVAAYELLKNIVAEFYMYDLWPEFYEDQEDDRDEDDYSW